MNLWTFYETKKCCSRSMESHRTSNNNLFYKNETPDSLPHHIDIIIPVDQNFHGRIIICRIKRTCSLCVLFWADYKEHLRVST